MDLLLLDLLQYSRLNGGELELLPVDLDAAVRDVLSSIEREVEDRKAEIRINGPLGLVSAHPATVRQVFYNLISNALKFVEPGKTPCVEIAAEHRDGVRKIWVTDRGIGIAPQHHHPIFGLIQRLHPPQNYP